MTAPYLGPIYNEWHWRYSGAPERMIEFLGERGSARRWQLFACQCCWRILPLLKDERSVRAVAVAERMAEGLVEAEEAARALEEARDAEVMAWQQRVPVQSLAATAARRALQSPRLVHETAAQATGSVMRAECQSQCALLRDLFGNPFQPIFFDPSWRSPLIVQMARDIYEQERFTDLPILGDALEDVGCQLAALLDHCRGSERHARGCWVVDAVLGREE